MKGAQGDPNNLFATWESYFWQFTNFALIIITYSYSFMHLITEE